MSYNNKIHKFKLFCRLKSTNLSYFVEIDRMSGIFCFFFGKLINISLTNIL